MEKTINTNQPTAKPLTKAELRLQIAEYVEQQTESKQALHKVMKVLEVLGLGLILAVFVAALYVSIAWKSVDPILIPTAWFAFAASAGPLSILIGLHTIMLRAFPPVILPNINMKKFVNGNEALWPGFGYLALGIALPVFWGYFAYAVWTFNMSMLEPLIRILTGFMGVAITVGILLAMVQKVVKTR